MRSAMRTMAESARRAWAPADFVPLAENRSALFAVRRLAGRLSQCPFTPLVLHCPPGTGKTHLANALHEYAAERVDVCRVGAADWVAGDPERRRCDLLIVEDLQHLPERSLDDFTATLDMRLARKRATLVTAKRGPAELAEIPGRLASRLAGGLVVGLEPFGRKGRAIFLSKL